MVQYTTFLYTMRCLVGIVCAVCLQPLVYAQPLTPTVSSTVERELFDFWQQHGTLPTTVAEAILIAEGADSASLPHYRTRLQRIYTALDSTIDTTESAYDKTQRIFTYLHSHVLAVYNGTASLRATLDSGMYNCTSAMALFYTTAQRYGLPISLYATPAHVFATLDTREQTVRIEITDAVRGFDFADNIPDVLQHLLQQHYITTQQLKEQSAETLYASFFIKANRITPPELVATSYNNTGVTHWHNRRFQNTVEAFEKAILLHPTSRAYRDAYQSALHLVFQQYEAEKNYDAIELLMRRSARLMQHDTLFIYYLLGTARNAIAHYTAQENDFYKSRALLDTLSHIMPHDSTVQALINEQQYIIDYNFAIYDYNRGDYEGAYLSCSRLAATDTSQNVATLHAQAAAYFALALANANQAERGYHLLDSLTTRYYHNTIFRNAYRQVTIDYVLQSQLISRAGTTTNDLIATRNLLLNVYTLDSANYYVQQLLAAVHHELAMHHLREQHYNAATEILHIGLQYDPNNTMIRESLQLIDSYLHSPNLHSVPKSKQQREPR